MRIDEVDEPAIAADEVLIEIVTVGINRADLRQREGFYPPPPGASTIIGMECSGRILAVGSHVTKWRAGEEVCALLAGGGYAEKAVHGVRRARLGRRLTVTQFASHPKSTSMSRPVAYTDESLSRYTAVPPRSLAVPGWAPGIRSMERPSSAEYLKRASGRSSPHRWFNPDHPVRPLPGKGPRDTMDSSLRDHTCGSANMRCGSGRGSSDSQKHAEMVSRLRYQGPSGRAAR
jgi:hypothetical protein